MSDITTTEELARLRARVSELEAGAWKHESLMHSIADGSPDNLMLVDRSYRVQYVNRTVPELTPEMVMGRSLLSFLTEEQHGVLIDAFQKVVETRETVEFEVVFHRAAGSDRVLRARVAPIVEDGAVSSFVLVTTDITARARATTELDRFFELSEDLLCVAGLDGFFKRLNPAWEQTLGYTIEELTSAPWTDFVHPDDLEATTEIAEVLAQGNVAHNFKNRYRAKGGGYRTLAWHGILDMDTNLLYAVARDVTQESILEEQVRQAQKMDAVGKLAGGIAHEFNNLMLSILVNTEFAFEDMPEGHPVIEHLNQIERAGRRAAGLTKQLLAFSRRQPLELVRVDVNDQIGRLLPLLQRLVDQSATLTFTGGAGLPKVAADPSQIEQVVVNLAVNARDALPDTGGAIVIETDLTEMADEIVERHPWARHGTFVRISVRDDGIGMSPQLVDRIFEPFFTTKPPGEGTGLGLSTVYGIVKQHRGFVLVESEPGSGTTADVYLPVA